MNARHLLLASILALPLAGALPALAEVPVPAAGQDTLLDAIKERGVLRVAAIGEFPWLPENTTGEGDRFSGPAWTLANEYAKRLGVTIEVVDVSHETKVPILATGQADISIAPLAETPARKEVVDFITYSQSSLCLYGLADNPKLADVADVDGLDRNDITIVYFTGTPPETWLPERFHNVQTRAVTGSGANTPVEEIISGRADIATIDNVAWPQLERSVPGLAVWPKGDGCLTSQEMAAPVGMAITKGHPVLLEWLTAVRDEMAPALQAEEIAIMKGE